MRKNPIFLPLSFFFPLLKPTIIIINFSSHHRHHPFNHQHHLTISICSSLLDRPSSSTSFLLFFFVIYLTFLLLSLFSSCFYSFSSPTEADHHLHQSSDSPSPTAEALIISISPPVLLDHQPAIPSTAPAHLFSSLALAC